MAGESRSLAYHEPPIATILNHTGFLFSLNLVNAVLDKLVYCGLVGQLFIGILWGAPGAKWLEEDVQVVIQQLGYLGLIALVYEGGLSVSLSSLRANLLISVAVALTGIGVPIGLSFILMPLLSATPLQAFAAGAALSATSLGTTFTILSTTNLMKTRLGTVTTSAAMLDDVVGLVMVQVITNLGESGASLDPVTVVRPIVVSVGFAVGLVLGCRFLLRPLFEYILAMKKPLPAFVKTLRFIVLVHVCVLFSMVAAATYAGASSLFAAYLAGVTIAWVDEFVESNRNQTPAADSDAPDAPQPSQQIYSGERVYELYFKEAVNRILKPLFFASIGFAIPITEMFQGEIVWRGVVYTILMTFAKLVTGLWLCRVSWEPINSLLQKVKSVLTRLPFCTASRKMDEKRPHGQDQSQTTGSETCKARSEQPAAANRAEGESPSQDESPRAEPQSGSSTPARNPKSLYPPSILGLAMVARGEIGYLIASLAETGGIFASSSEQDSENRSSETFLVVVWAITLCTLIGPISVGTLVRRVKRLQSERQSSNNDPLGVWGI